MPSSTSPFCPATPRLSSLPKVIITPCTPSPMFELSQPRSSFPDWAESTSSSSPRLSSNQQRRSSSISTRFDAIQVGDYHGGPAQSRRRSSCSSDFLQLPRKHSTRRTRDGQSEIRSCTISKLSSPAFTICFIALAALLLLSSTMSMFKLSLHYQPTEADQYSTTRLRPSYSPYSSRRAQKLDRTQDLKSPLEEMKRRTEIVQGECTIGQPSDNDRSNRLPGADAWEVWDFQ